MLREERKNMWKFESKRKKLEKLLDSIPIIRIETEDESEDFIEIVLPLDEEYMYSLNTLLKKRVKVLEEDIAELEEYIAYYRQTYIDDEHKRLGKMQEILGLLKEAKR